MPLLTWIDRYLFFLSLCFKFFWDCKILCGFNPLRIFIEVEPSHALGFWYCHTLGNTIFFLLWYNYPNTVKQCFTVVLICLYLIIKYIEPGFLSTHSILMILSTCFTLKSLLELLTRVIDGWAPLINSEGSFTIWGLGLKYSGSPEWNHQVKSWQIFRSCPTWANVFNSVSW